MNNRNFDSTLISLLMDEFVSMDDAARIDAIMTLDVKDRYLLVSMIGNVLKANRELGGLT